MENNKMEFETFRNISGYEINNLTKTEPSAINFLSYRKSKITIELIEEPKEVLIERLEKMLEGNKNSHQKNMINSELKHLKSQ